MENFLIKSAKCDAAGPLEGVVVAEVELECEDGNICYYSLAEVDGMPNIIKTNVSTFDAQIGDIDDETVKLINDNIVFGGEYDELFDDKENEMMQLYRYLIYIVRTDWDDCHEYIENTVGKRINEIEIPLSDIEEEYLDEYYD